MCGIIAIVTDGALGASAYERAEAMLHAIRHRGPDSSAVWAVLERTNGDWYARQVVDGQQWGVLRLSGDRVRCIVGAARFAIQDPTDRANQPLLIHNSILVALNGEIYNYKEARGNLSCVSWQTSGDTEVFGRAVVDWRDGIFERLEGFWCGIVCDLQARKIWVTRDSLGERPLYTRSRDGEVEISSEIRSLRDPVVSRRDINDEATSVWLRFQTKDHDQRTLFSGIDRFESGLFADFSSGRPVTYTCHKLKATEEIDASDSAIIQQRLRESLVRSVELRCVSDQPIALELSGGLDSSAIAWALGEIGRQDVCCYTSVFSGFSPDLAFARRVASHFGFRLREIHHDLGDISSRLAAMVDSQEEPFHSPNLLLNQDVWYAMKRDGIRVSLHGAGGDEILGGYRIYLQIAVQDALRNLRFREAWDNAWQDSEPAGFRGSALVRAASRLAWLNLNGRAREARESLRDRLDREIHSSLLPYWLTSSDKASMAVPIEVRYPFLARDIARIGLALPAEQLIRNGWKKWSLRAALSGYLPDEIVWRKRKQGYPVAESAMRAMWGKQENRAIDALRRNGLSSYANGVPSRLPWRYISTGLWLDAVVGRE